MYGGVVTERGVLSRRSEHARNHVPDEGHILFSLC